MIRCTAPQFPSICRLLPGQMRLGECFYTLLHHEEELPATHGQPLLLRRIVCSKLGCFAELAPGGLSSRAFRMQPGKM